MNPLQQLQEDCVAMLLGNPATASVPFQTFRSMAIDSAVKDSLAAWAVRATGQVGVSCLVLMPTIESEYPNVPGPQGVIEIVLRTFEDPKVNNTGLTAEDVALANLAWMDGLIIEDLTQLYPGQKGPSLKPNYDYPGFLVYDTVLAGKLPQNAVSRTVDPSITDDGAGNVTLACGDSAAGIFYTLDGSCPQPGSTAASSPTLPYTSPILVISGTVIRFVAWNPALLPSHVNKATVKIP
jgi:Chitobiase/beta-hexosaminidase C-terminal domain